MASPYKLPMLGAFLLATGFSIWTGTQLATQKRVTRPLRPLNESATTPPSTQAKSTQSKDTRVSSTSLSFQTETAVQDGIELEECVVTMAQVNDPRPPLSIRDAPSPQGNVIGEANDGQIIDVAGTQGEWFAVTAPVQGWAPRSLTNYACNEKVARVAFPRGKRDLDLAGSFVGTGNHQYKLRASKNQTLTLTNLSGPMPVLTTPDNQVLFSGPDEGDPSKWSGKLPSDGDYLLKIDSTFRGYEYRFNVRVD